MQKIALRGRQALDPNADQVVSATRAIGWAGTRRLGEQALPLVEPDGLNADPGRSGQRPDGVRIAVAHTDSIKPCTLVQSRGRHSFFGGNSQSLERKRGTMFNSS